MIQLKKLLEGMNIDGNPVKPTAPVAPQSSQGKEDKTPKMSVDEKKKLVTMVARYNEYGKSVYRETKITEVAKNLQEIADLSEAYAINECGDWFEENTVKRHYQEIKKYSEQFGKLAKEVQIREQQLEALYEDIGKKLEMYFDIDDPQNNQQSGQPQSPTK